MNRFIKLFIWAVLIAVCLCAVINAFNVESIGKEISDIQMQVSELTERVVDLEVRVSALESVAGG